MGAIASMILRNALLAAMAFPYFSRHRSEEPPRRILLLRTAALGDFIMTLPAIGAVRKAFPSAQLVLLTTSTTQASNRRLVEGYAGSGDMFPWLSLSAGLLDEVITWRGGNPLGVLRQLRERISALNPDLAFVLNDVGAPMLGTAKKILFLRVVGVHGRIYGWRTRGDRDVLQGEHHVFGPLRSVAEHPDIPLPDKKSVQLRVPASPESEKWAAVLWEQHGWLDKSVIAMAPGSLQPHKRWPLEKYCELAKGLVKGNADVRVIVVGTKNDHSLGEEIVRRAGPVVVNLAGKTTLEQSAAIFRRSALLVGNDGGAMHLGAAAGCRVVSLIPGIERPGAVDPWGNENLSVRHAVPCSPCYSFTHCPRGHRECMTGIRVDDVLGKCLGETRL